jgi:hypothetical protein
MTYTGIFLLYLDRKEGKTLKTTNMFCESNSDAHIKKVWFYHLNATNVS